MCSSDLITRHFSTFPQLLKTARSIRYALPAGLETEADGAGEIDRDAQQRIAAYCKAGTVNDLANAARYLLHRAGVLDEAPAAPGQPILSGIYHAESPQLWHEVASYLAWMKGRITAPDDREPPIVAILFDRNAWIGGETEIVDACIQHLESAGFAPMPMFCD